MRRKALAQQGVYVKYTGCRAWRLCPMLTVCGYWLAIYPRSGIKPSAYSLASIQLRNFATQVGVSLRGVGDHVLPLTKGLSGADG